MTTLGQPITFEDNQLLSRMDGAVLVITINRPKSYNAWTAGLRAELARRVRSADADDAVDAIVLTGAGDKAFCAGQDLHESTTKPSGEGIAGWMDAFADCLDAIRGFGKPLVAAVNGVAAGSGFQLVQFCDYAVGHSGSRMGQTEVKQGMPSIFGTWLMSERIGRAAYELSLTARLMDGPEAKELGFINEVVSREQVLDAAVAVARQLAQQPRIAYRLSKKANRRLDEDRYRNALMLAAEFQAEAFATGSPQQVIAAFFETRKGRKAAAAAT